jgi:hypothetical protein
MADPITRDEISRCPRAFLARAIAWQIGLTDAEREEVVDAGLASEDDFESIPGPDADTDAHRWAYAGSAWGVTYGCGRPILVEAIHADRRPFDARQRTEYVAALFIDMLEAASGRRWTPDEVEMSYEEGKWPEAIEEAERADREAAETPGESDRDG